MGTDIVGRVVSSKMKVRHEGADMLLEFERPRYQLVRLDKEETTWLRDLCNAYLKALPK
jgi:hypothetical protein